MARKLAVAALNLHKLRAADRRVLIRRRPEPVIIIIRLARVKAKLAEGSVGRDINGNRHN